jgi:hypothetical protein
MILSVDIISLLLQPLPLGSFLPSLPLDSLFSTQGIMVMLLAAYAVAMWMFLTSAPKVHTIMVSDLEIARRFYEGLLNLAAAEVPLHYYYNYEQTLGATGIDPLYMSAGMGTTSATGSMVPRALVSAKKEYSTARHHRGKYWQEKPATSCLLRP